MKYFAVDHDKANEVNEYLQSIGHFDTSALSIQFVMLFRNTLSDEDFLILRLKYRIIMPTHAQLQIVESIYKINLNLDDSST